MNDDVNNDLTLKIEEEIAFARAITALTLAIAKDKSEVQSTRMEYRLKAKQNAIESDLNRMAS